MARGTAFWRRAAARILKRAAAGRRPAPAEAPAPGLPPGLSVDDLQDVLWRETGQAARRFAFLHLSSWKPSGSCRLYLELENGAPWTVIFKNALYTADQAPALEGFPLRPGPPEFAVYRRPEGPLRPFLPRVFLCREVVPARHYNYLLEDLSGTHERANRIESVLAVASRLREIHEALSAWAVPEDRERLLLYDRGFSDALREYARRNLERYVRAVDDDAVSRIYRRWPEIAAMHAREDFACADRILHGDFGPSNILIHTSDPSRLKLIDWEWTGYGLAEADLASLLKGVSADVERGAVAIYLHGGAVPTRDRSARLYLWCRLERGLLDAAFIAAQALDASNDARLNLRGFVRKALQRAEGAYEDLRKGS
jgi:hypothetical protein